jgi:hypothetical protein
MINNQKVICKLLNNYKIPILFFKASYPTYQP